MKKSLRFFKSINEHCCHVHNCTLDSVIKRDPLVHNFPLGVKGRARSLQQYLLLRTPEALIVTTDTHRFVCQITSQSFQKIPSPDVIAQNQHCPFLFIPRSRTATAVS